MAMKRILAKTAGKAKTAAPRAKKSARTPVKKPAARKPAPRG